GECWGGACSGFGFARRETQGLQHQAVAAFEGLQIRWLRGTEHREPLSLKLHDDVYRPAGRSQSASGEALGAWGGPGGAVPILQAVPQGAEPRALFQTTHSRFLTQKEAAVVCPAEGPQSRPIDCELRVPETHIVCARLPSLPDDDVFLEEVPLVRMRAPPDSPAPPRLPASVHASDSQPGAGLGQRPGRATVSPEHPLPECVESAGTDDCWPTCCGSPGTANGDVPTHDCTGLLTTDFPAAVERDSLKPLPVDALGPPGSDTQGPPDDTAWAWGPVQPDSKPTWPSPRLEQLVQELARLDPSLSDTLTSYPSPEPPLDLLDGLIPLAEVWAAMRPAGGKAGEEAAGISEPGSTQVLPTSQEEARPENLTPPPVSDQPCGQGLPEPNCSIQAKKVELADLLQKMLRSLQAEQEQLQGTAQTWARRGAALEALREVLVRALPAGELRAYCALLAGKAAVLAQQRSLDERVRLLQDQLEAVRSGLGHQPPSPRPASSHGNRPPDKPPFSPLLI
ncbi:PREDICTED: protein Shroom1, partial [Myotis davidii]|uniref:protein Shroom1 n=1 Tax=Myotis davidii TaxID=225400 RepID=UPI0003EC1E23